MYKHDEETKRFLAKAKSIFKKEMSNIEHILKEYEQFEDKKKDISSSFATDIFATGSKMLTFQILENLERGFLLIALIGLRTLLENYINVHYIFRHPKHIEDYIWSEKLCRDYFNRTLDLKARKSKLGEVSLYKRAKSAGIEELYDEVYSELCNYSHFLANITFSTIDSKDIKSGTIWVAIYAITLYQDILAAIIFFFHFSFDDYIEEILDYKKEGEQILNQ